MCKKDNLEGHLRQEKLVKGEIKSLDIPGEHLTRTHMMYEPFVKYVAEELKKYLS
ncbi:hypothetical protein SAE01_33100 [Segetibacter aerophilus]|uniref:Uncharacterized protein n=1 Tax=Segetibacter aerophilus TaxID=670293 RepID=A0A512BFS1_9BACT|nr:hypothetical protein SAE01_33100 [Segetibacter aerophilus]